MDIPANRFVEYKISLRTQKADLTPYVHNFSIGYHHYICQGQYISVPMEQVADIPTARVYWNGTDNGGLIGINVSNDNGTNWEVVTGKGENITFDNPGTWLRYRITMSHKGDNTPILNDITLHYGLVSEPSNIKVDVGHVGIVHFFHNGTLAGPTNVFITDALNDYIADNAVPGENVSIPIQISSSTQGKIRVYNLRIIVDLPLEIRRYSPVETNPMVNETEKLSFSIDVHDPDGKPMTYRWYFNNELQTTATGSSWSLGAMDAPPGTYPVKVVVTDGRFSVNHTWDLDVIHVNKGPEIISKTPNNLDLGILQPPLDNITFVISSIDPDGDELNYTWKLSGRVIEGADGNNWTWTETTPVPNDYIIEVEVTDGEFKVNVTWKFTIVLPKNNAPVIMSYEPKGSVEIIAGTIQNLSVNAMDVDRDPLSFNWTVNGNTTGTYDSRYVFEPEEEGTYLIKVVVSDGDLSAEYE